MYTRSAYSQLAILLVVSLLMAFTNTATAVEKEISEKDGPVYRISRIESELRDNSLSFTIIGDSIPAFTVSERFAPFRVVIDIAGALFAEDIDEKKPLFPQNSFSSSTTTLLHDQEPAITRLEIQLADSHNYKVNRSGNDIQVIISPASANNSDSVAQTGGSIPSITDFRVTSTPSETIIILVSDKLINDFKAETIAGGDDLPARMFIDIANVTIDELVREKQLGTTIEKIRVAPRGSGARIVFDSASKDLFEYTVSSTDAGIQVVVKEAPAAIASPEQPMPVKSEAVADSTLDALIESSGSLLSKDSQDSGEIAIDRAASLEDNFVFSGYTKQRISVDFYKIDIHNVFRLFRQITDLNIIVDEGVQGSLTLALTDVPWDFALDIILNLTDLRKEERYNTIVIYPKKKEFAWPERAEDNLSFEADVEVVEQEALIISQSANQPKEILQAQELIRKARVAEKKEDFAEAAAIYEEAVTLWPSNSKLHNRLATLYLVHLRMNAKAVYYAKESLNRDPANTKAALYAAIGSANMQRIEEASEYFAQSISGTPPMREALFSYAAFSENNNQNIAALKLLEKYNSFYGETIETMLAKARILDKNGETQQATEQYKAILTSGFQLRPDLKKYIRGRIAADAF